MDYIGIAVDGVCQIERKDSLKSTLNKLKSLKFRLNLI